MDNCACIKICVLSITGSLGYYKSNFAQYIYFRRKRPPCPLYLYTLSCRASPCGPRGRSGRSRLGIGCDPSQAGRRCHF